MVEDLEYWENSRTLRFPSIHMRHFTLHSHTIFLFAPDLHLPNCLHHSLPQRFKSSNTRRSDPTTLSRSGKKPLLMVTQHPQRLVFVSSPSTRGTLEGGH